MLEARGVALSRGGRTLVHDASFLIGRGEKVGLVGVNGAGKATLLHAMRRKGVRATVITRDKDLAQLTGDGDVYWDFGGRVACGYHDIKNRFGVVPEGMADFLALTRDAVDNIKGVPGIGAKTAAALMEEFASLDAIYSDLEQVAKMKMRGAAAIGARLREHRETAYLARQLTDTQGLAKEIAGSGLGAEVKEAARKLSSEIDAELKAVAALRR